MRTAPIGPLNGRSQGQCCRCRVDAQDIGIAQAITAHEHVVDLYFAVEVRGKERPNRTVRYAHRENFFLRWARFTLDVAPGKRPAA